MNVMLISQCRKNALTETRRILDQFAERRGDRTWQTSITQQGLQTLHKMLRKTARRNTAVACHWIRGKGHTELIWVVGDAGRFNAHGAAPTNTTERDVLRRKDENDWHTIEDIRLLVILAALFHDLGKASRAFDKKLRGGKPIADAFRHEWVSLRLLEAFVNGRNDEEWLASLTVDPGKKGFFNGLSIVRDGLDKRPLSPFESLPPLARMIGWLIVAHHRLPVQMREAIINSRVLECLPESIEEQWCGSRPDAGRKDIEACWTFMKKDVFDSKSWRREVARVAREILNRRNMLASDWLKNPYAASLSRLVLMLADHYYSGEPSRRRYGDPDHPLYANTDRATRELKQRLDEHLIGVAVNAGRVAWTLPGLARQAPRIARHKGFRRRSEDRRFKWQDRAFDLASSVRERAARQGFFGVNMASTGCGKTLANGRILYALADPQLGARFNIALGLRTLTLQTGDACRERLGLGAEDLAVLVGGGAVRALHEHYHESEFEFESDYDLLPDNMYVHYEGGLEDGPLNRWLRSNVDAQKLLDAPILVCTIDHLIPATENTRGGRQIAPMLRLMTSDLVLDEPDDFGMEDLPALTRLVHCAGMLGGRVLLSSATLPPSLIQGLYAAYLEGRRSFQENRGEPGQPLNICCAWFDEFGAEASEHSREDGFREAHDRFVDKRLRKLSKAEQRRKAEIKPLPIAPGRDREAVCDELADYLNQYLHELHQQHHNLDPAGRKKVSLGLIRMANIDPLVETARRLYALGARTDCRIHLCVYHSQHPLLVRSGIERRLDRLLNRNDPGALFRDPEIVRVLEVFPETNHIFVVMATAVAEVGRDHDYDWAVVEPSSMRSIIQLAGRVRRHRPGECQSPNLYLLDANVRYLTKGPGEPSFCRPGFEDAQFRLVHHRLTELLTKKQLAVINSAGRIKEAAELHPDKNLVDLEHARLRSLMIESCHGEPVKTKPVSWWWTTPAHLCGELQRKQPFRNDPMGRRRYELLPDEDNRPQFNRLEKDGTRTPVHENLLHEIHFSTGPRIRFWGEPDYMDALETLAESLDMDPLDCARRFGAVELPAKGADQGWLYHPALGFSRKH